MSMNQVVCTEVDGDLSRLLVICLHSTLELSPLGLVSPSVADPSTWLALQPYDERSE